MSDRTSIEAVVPTGGLAQRLDGAVKGEIDIGCGPILTGELDAVVHAGIARAVVVGPGPIHAPNGLDVVVTREDPPFGGPTAAVAAALEGQDYEHDPKRLGRYLQTKHGQIIDGVRLEMRKDSHRKINVFRAIRLEVAAEPAFDFG